VQGGGYTPTYTGGYSGLYCGPDTEAANLLARPACYSPAPSLR